MTNRRSAEASVSVHEPAPSVCDPIFLPGVGFCDVRKCDSASVPYAQCHSWDKVRGPTLTCTVRSCLVTHKVVTRWMQSPTSRARLGGYCNHDRPCDAWDELDHGCVYVPYDSRHVLHSRLAARSAPVARRHGALFPLLLRWIWVVGSNLLLIILHCMAPRVWTCPTQISASRSVHSSGGVPIFAIGLSYWIASARGSRHQKFDGVPVAAKRASTVHGGRCGHDGHPCRPANLVSTQRIRLARLLQMATRHKPPDMTRFV